MQNHEKTRSRNQGQRALGKAVARRRDQLDQMKAEDKRRQQEERARREALARELAHLESQERLARRQQEASDRKRTCFILGEQILADLVQSHSRGGDGHQALMGRLSPTQMDLVNLVVSRIAQDKKPASEEPSVQEPAPTVHIDILL